MRFEIYKDSKNEFRWSLIASNGRVIADSAEGYVQKADAVRGITLVRSGAPYASIKARLVPAPGKK